MIELKVKKLYKDSKMPLRAHIDDAGMDLYYHHLVKLDSSNKIRHYPLEDQAVIRPGEKLIVATGVSIELPDYYEAQIRPRSGLALKFGLTVINSPGTIDPGFRGEILVILHNLGEDPIAFDTSTRIAQMCVRKFEPIRIVEIGELSDSERGSGGFGSTG